MSQQTPNRFSRGGMARWSVYHPIGVIMISLAIVVIGTLSYKGLEVNLLPRVVKPEIRVRILQTGVPARIMEDKVTRQLEEQLAITEDAISVESTSSEGRSSVNLSFEYGKDIDVALRDASTRLDRAKRFLPKDADQPIIYKRDPMQMPALEFMVSSTALDTIKLRTWVEVDLSKWLLTLPGVTAVEVGGGKVREIQVLPDQQKLASRNLSFDDLIDAIKNSNIEVATGRLHIGNKEISSRATSNIKSIKQLKNLPILLADGSYIRLKEVARVNDSHEDEKLRVRLNDVPGIKVSVQKRPTANTIKVVDAIRAKLDALEKSNAIPAHINIKTVDDQSVYIRAALNNAKWAASLGAGLAMIIVFVFLGDIRRTLIIGSAIPIAIVVTFLLMNTLGLTLNIMTLGGLAVGIGMLVDNTIVMLENIHRQQQIEADAQKAAVAAAGEINSAIVASTTTNLAAIIPFLFIGGFLGLLFKELIITISSAMVASMIVALTLVPALAAKLRSMNISSERAESGRLMQRLQTAFADQIKSLLVNTTAKILLVSIMVILLVIVTSSFTSNKKQDLLPSFDTGFVKMIIFADTGTTLDETDQNIKSMEVMIRNTLPNVKNVFTIAGGFIYGRSTFESHNRGFVVVELEKPGKRKISTTAWIAKFRRAFAGLKLAGLSAIVYPAKIRGLHVGRGNDDISLRIRGDDIKTLRNLGDLFVEKLSAIKGLSRAKHSLDSVKQSLNYEIIPEDAVSLGLNSKSISSAIKRAVSGETVTDYIEGDRSYNIVLKLAKSQIKDLQQLKSLIVGHNKDSKQAILLGQVAKVGFPTAPATIMRDNQWRIVEITASLDTSVPLGTIVEQINNIKKSIKLPNGYSLYNAGVVEALKKNKGQVLLLVLLAIFLVFVVLAVQYESLRDPFIIIISVPFTLIGVKLGLWVTQINISLMTWLGIIMLIGIVVNNAIVLLEYIKLERAKGHSINDAIVEAARLRLRPILMTTLTTVAGLTPLAIAWGEGAEMLKPLAIAIVFGLSFSLLISLFLIPVIYQYFHQSKKP